MFYKLLNSLQSFLLKLLAFFSKRNIFENIYEQNQLLVLRIAKVKKFGKLETSQNTWLYNNILTLNIVSFLEKIDFPQIVNPYFKKRYLNK